MFFERYEKRFELSERKPPLLAPLDFRPSYGPVDLESIGTKTRPAENTSSSFEQKLISFFAKSLLTVLTLIVQWFTKVTKPKS